MYEKIIGIVSMVLLIVACQDDEVKYSCNPNVDNYVKSSYNELYLMDSYEFSSLAIEVQRAAFRSFSPEKKHDLWFDRLNLILCNETWSEEEYLHIYSLIEFLDIDLFVSIDPTSLYASEIKEFSSEWINYAYETLAWDKSRLAFVVSSLSLNFDDYLLQLSEIKTIRSSTQLNDESSCDCNITSNYCSVSLDCYPGCISSNGGCGWLWSEPCNGICH